MGLKLTAEGTDITVTGADAFTWIAVAVAAAIVFAFQLFRDHIMGNLSGVAALNPLANREPLPDEKRLRLENIGLVLLIAIALVWPFFVSRGAVDLATLVLIYIMLALGLNVVVGLAGLLDLGYVAFYAVGAYTFALLSNYWGVSFWMALPVGALLAALFGLVLGFPVLRLRGDYLAIVTLGFGEIIRILLNNWTSVTRRHSGPDPVRHGVWPPGQGRGQHLLPRDLWHWLFQRAQGYFPVPDCAGTGDLYGLRYPPVDAHAGGPLLGSTAGGRNCCPLPRPEPHRRETLGLYHRRLLRRLCRYGVCLQAGFYQPGVVRLP
jgi:hypothetical protein